MLDNSPPRIPDIEADVEEIPFDNEVPPEDLDDEEWDMEEVSFEELESRFQNENDDDFDEDAPDEAQLTYRKHSAPVFSCHQHPFLNIAVTGGEDDKALVWDTTDGKTIFTIDGHTDTVVFAQFNHDGRYLATGDMNGELFVYKIAEPNAHNNITDDAMTTATTATGEAAAATTETTTNNGPEFTQIWQYSMGDMSWMRWHFASPILFAGSDSGEIYFWRIPSGHCKVLPSAGGRCETGELSYNGKKLFASYAEHKVKLWDLKTCQIVFEVDDQHPMGHKGEIVTVACDKESPVYVSGDVNGKILVCTNNGPVSTHTVDDSIECLAFSPSTDLKLFASGCIGGKVIIWDYSKNAQRCICDNTSESSDGIPSMVWINEYTLIVGTIKGKIHAYDGRTGQLKFTLSGHLAHIYDLSYKKENNCLLSASEDMTAKVFQVPYYCE